MPKLKITLAAIALSAGLGMSAASAMPVSDLGGVKAGPSAQVDQVRLVCNRWGRCWRTGGYRYYGGYRGYRGYGYRHYRRW